MAELLDELFVRIGQYEAKVSGAVGCFNQPFVHNAKAIVLSSLLVQGIVGAHKWQYYNIFVRKLPG